MKTSHLKTEQLHREWYEIDAEGKTVGRLASEIAKVLIGKHKPTFSKHMDNGDFVVVTNADKVVFTGKKWEQKKYYRHSGYPGGLKETSAARMQKTHPERILRSAVYGMLPKNRLRADRIKRMKLFVTAEHNHQAQQPKPLVIQERKR